MKNQLWIFLTLVLGGLIAWPTALPVRAVAPGTVITVTTSLDQIADDAQCSLREAIQAANLDQAYGGCPAGSGQDTIMLPGGTYSLSILGLGEDQGLIGDLDITAPLTLIGSGVDQTTIDGLLKDRIFHIVPPKIQVSISHVTLKNGYVASVDLLGGGAILSWGHLTLNDVKIQDSQASRGGGVRNSLGKLTITHSEVLQNHSDFEGGGIYGDGEIVIADSKVLENSSDFGGGISADGHLELARVTIQGNQAIQSGGGIFTDFTTSIKQVALISNHAVLGGGLYNNHEAMISNGTFGENQAVNPDPDGSEHGGGIYNNGTLLLVNNTLSANQAGRGGGIYNSDLGEVTLVNTILADNAGGNCANFGEQISLGYNLEDSLICKFDQPSDRQATDPMLAPLADELGIIATYALLTGSPAIDATPDDYCPFSDQRGVIRPVDGDRNGTSYCDIGAHENTPGGILRFSPLEQSVLETAGSLILAVTRTGGSGGVGAGYGPGAGTAVHRADFNLAPGSLSWSSSDHSPKTFQVEIVDDPYVENDEYGLVLLSNATGGAGILNPGYLFRFVISANDPGGPPQPYGPVFLPLSLN